jgi:hypothetical protein
MPLRYNHLPDGLPIDWPMILVGWHGFARRKLSTQQVIDHALEQIGRGTPEQDELAALLVNTDPGEWQTINRYLQQLAETQQFDRNIALRKWRLAELKFLIDDVLPLDEGGDEEEPYSNFYAFVDFWQAYAELPDSLVMIPDWGMPTKELVSQQQTWAEQEEILLREQNAESKSKHNVMDFYGVGRDAWKGVDVQKYINEMRDEWDCK